MSPPVDALVAQCQILIGQFCEQADAESLLFGISRGLENLSSAALSQAEERAIDLLLLRLFAHLLERLGLDDDPRLAWELVRTTTGDVREPAPWPERWIRATATFATVAAGNEAVTAQAHGFMPSDLRVRQILHNLDARYADSSYDISVAAQLVNLSPWHAARLLRLQTGLGFLAHRHHRRTAVARQLLERGVLSVKEIATAVGYSHPSQLTRQFKAAFGVSPTAFRSGLSARAQSA